MIEKALTLIAVVGGTLLTYMAGSEYIIQHHQ